MVRHTSILLSIAMIGLLAVPWASVGAQDQSHGELDDDLYRLIAEVRAATADFHDLTEAEAAGYGLFLGCMDNPDVGAMGQHYVRGELLDDTLDPLRPEALMYEPREDGNPILVGLEYLVFQDQWASDEPPTLFGQEFHLQTEIPETPPVWALHLWLSHNPDGLFADFNPTVFCPADAE